MALFAVNFFQEHRKAGLGWDCFQHGVTLCIAPLRFLSQFHYVKQLVPSVTSSGVEWPIVTLDLAVSCGVWAVASLGLSRMILLPWPW